MRIESSTHILNIMATEGRKFGLDLILASQMRKHFGAEVKSSAASRLLMKSMAMDEAKKNAENVGVSAQAMLDLNERGHGYLRTRSNPNARNIQVSRLPEKGIANVDVGAPGETWCEQEFTQGGDEGESSALID